MPPKAKAVPGAAPSRGLRGACSFNRVVLLGFALYCASVGSSIWKAFYPPVHQGPREQGHPPLWDLADPVDVRVYASDSPQYSPRARDLLWSLTDQPVGQANATAFNLTLSKAAQSNGTMYAHVLLMRRPKGRGDGPRPEAGDVVLRTAALTAHSPCRRNATRTLLSAAPEPADPAAPPSPTYCNFLKPRLVVRVVNDATVYPPSQVPPEVVAFTQFLRNAYQPVLYIDETWLLPDGLLPIVAGETGELPFEVQYKPISLGLWRLLLRFDNAMATVKGMLGDDSEEADNLRRMFTETHPLLLLTTLVVTVLHTLFDILAFKNDISFWRSRTTMEGLSANNVVADLVCQVIILAYLWDTNSGALILLTMAAGVVIQLWKTTVALRLKKLGKDSSTARADAKAMKWLSLLLYPFVIGYAVYSLLYKEHRRWASWAIESLASAVYAFGFILMTPQLYINYKLKSVAQLPWRVFGYRAMNTFIDDLFAFIIKMPAMHRLSTFRDDVVFLVYLYQRYLYPVDHSRPVEGLADEDAAPAVGAAAAGKAPVKAD